ncbi:hypothetical protein EKN56_01565 [Limnobaculum zhutongyuii]|uniref:Uncharacterized protein n=1 Tax=Limnobaculum zhutongyuii TaxID=2498113 RepID=A0A411WGL8_9GAMM|nr:hypothetical protein [Limnobaculum zhutongyuii]QBH95206.1 hypothetical protein EKN56_01565 [Limnobaculum zhutongyuii]TQS89175.1 hypothetical protein ELQ32_08335 [Limnobaculum zhutongyuii]
MLFNFFRQKNKPSSKLFIHNISHINFALPDWELYRQDENSASWFTQQREAALLRLFPPCSWPFFCHDISQAEAYWQDGAKQQNGVLIEIDCFEVEGIPALRGVFKYRSPETGSLAMYYLGIIWIPFKDALYQINYEALEKGTTGIREAAVFVATEKPGLPEQQDTELVSAEELFDKLCSHEVRKIPSDSREYDAMFPDHPLSRVRYWLNEFPTQVKISGELKHQPVYTPE